jgi:hypothetical protein
MKSKFRPKESSDWTTFYNWNGCKHKRMILFDKYFNLYRCENCDSFWIPSKESKTRITWSYAHVDFSSNDDRIINVWCQDLVDDLRKRDKKLLNKEITIEEYYYGKKRKYLSKEEKKDIDDKIEWKKKCKLMYSK